MTRPLIHLLTLLLLSPPLSLLPPVGGAQEEEAERILWIETPHEGPFVANSSVLFSCIHKLKAHYAQLSWSFLLSSSNSSNSSIPALIDSTFDDISVGFNRTSSIRIPSEDVSALSCEWSEVGGSRTSASLPIEVTGLPPKVEKREAEREEDLCKLEGPQIFVLKSNGCKSGEYERMTGKEVSVDATSSEGLILQCVQSMEPGEEKERLQWSLLRPDSSEEKKTRPSPTVVLNYLALINWKMRERLENLEMTANNTKCHREASSASKSLWTKERCPVAIAGPLEIFVAPEKSEVSSVFKCSNGTGGPEASVTLRTLPAPPRVSPEGVKDENKEFIELVNILMQILQSSSESSSSSGGGGSGSGPLYGMGFGSTTIIALMAIAIYYLKRQIKQLQEEVETRDRRRRKSRPSNAYDDEEDDL